MEKIKNFCLQKLDYGVSLMETNPGLLILYVVGIGCLLGGILFALVCALVLVPKSVWLQVCAVLLLGSAWAAHSYFKRRSSGGNLRNLLSNIKKNMKHGKS